MRRKGAQQPPEQNRDEQTISDSSLSKLVGAADTCNLEEMEPPSTLISSGCQSQRKELTLRKKQIGYVTSEVVQCYMLSSDLVSSCVDSSRFYGSWKDSGDIFSDTHKTRPILVLPPTDSQITECEQSEAERELYDALFRRPKVPQADSQQYADLDNLARRFQSSGLTLRRTGRSLQRFQSSWNAWNIFVGQITLRRRGTELLRFDGKLQQKQRERVLKKFSETKERTDPWWNPAVEEQAIMYLTKSNFESETPKSSKLNDFGHGGGTPARSSSKEVRSARIEELEMLFYFEVLFVTINEVN
ncbi:hypothetical protein NC652_025208 [Populus alba x Populus x berolinensis]|nr:hypothetical protein NC652_025208 [Populus alba x Populus x berolinensis]